MITSNTNKAGKVDKRASGDTGVTGFAGDKADNIESGNNGNKAERRLILILTCVQFAHILDFILIMPLGPQLIRAFELNASQLGWLVSSYTFAAAFSGLLTSYMMDRINRKSMLTVFCFVFASSTLACAFTSSFNFLLLARSLAGASGGVLNGILLAIIGDQIPKNRRGAAIGKVMSSFAMASVAGIPLSLYLTSIWGWRSPFLCLGVITFLIIFLVRKLVLTPELSEMEQNIPDGPNKKGNPFIYGLASTFCLMFAGFSVVPFVSTSLVANAGVEESKLFFVYLIAGLVSFLFSRIVGNLSDHFGKLKIFIIICFCSVISTLIITRLESVGIILSTMATALFMSLNSSRNIPLLSLLVSNVPVQSRGRFMSLNSSAQHFAAGTGAAISSNFVNTNHLGQLTGFGTVGVISILAVLCSVAMANNFSIKSK